MLIATREELHHTAQENAPPQPKRNLKSPVATREEHQVLHHNSTGVLCHHKEGAPSDETRTPPPLKTGDNFPAKTREEPSDTLHVERSPCAANSDEATEVTQENLSQLEWSNPMKNS